MFCLAQCVWFRKLPIGEFSCGLQRRVRECTIQFCQYFVDVDVTDYHNKPPLHPQDFLKGLSNRIRFHISYQDLGSNAAEVFPSKNLRPELVVKPGPQIGASPAEFRKYHLSFSFETFMVDQGIVESFAVYFNGKREFVFGKPESEVGHVKRRGSRTLSAVAVRLAVRIPPESGFPFLR